jgi:TPR repeat protein
MKAAHARDVEGEAKVADMLSQGNGVERDLAEGIVWCRKDAGESNSVAPTTC